MIDLHNYKRRFERTLERIETLKICKQDKEVMYKFKDYCLCMNISLGKIDRYLSDIIKFTKMLKKPIKNATKEDLQKVIGDLNQTELSEETKKSFKIMLRRLYRLVRGIETKGKYPEEVEWISIAIPNHHRKLPEELLTEKEVQSIVKNCIHLRDKALIATIAESGCRVSEIGLMKIKHVSFEEYGARLTVNGKTGMRKILIVNSAPYLQEWINQHTENNDPDAYLWQNSQGESRNKFLGYKRIVNILKMAVKRAKIKKRVHLHLLRHSRATALARIMSDASMKHYFGWAQGSKMAGIYIHMSGKDTDESILKANGIEIKDKATKAFLKPIVCQKCKTTNEATNKFCKICGLILDKEEAEKAMKQDSERVQLDDLMTKAIQDPKIQKMLIERMMQLKTA